MAAEHVIALGERIRQRREELGLTQEEVARRMPGKVAGARISLWERGEHRPHDANLEELARALETSAAALLSPPPDKRRTPQLSDVVGESQLDRIEQRLNEARTEQDRISGLIEQQNANLNAQTQILTRLGRVLERIEDAIEREEEAAKRRADDETWVEQVKDAVREAFEPAAQSAGSKRRTRAKSGSPQA